DSVPVHRDRRTDRTYPRSPRAVVVSRASTLAIYDMRLHLSDSRRTDHFGWLLGQVDSKSQIHPSRDPGHTLPHSDRFRHGAFASSEATADLRAARFRWPRD